MFNIFVNKLYCRMLLKDVNIYRITHLENIPHILQYGITHKNSSNRNPKFRSIGDSSLIMTRSSKHVYVENGVKKNRNTPIIQLGDYIPFYFGVRMPMLFVIQNGGNFVPNATRPEDIIYLVCRLVKVIEDGRIFYFSDGHGTDSFSTFYDRSKLNDLPSIVDWTSVTAAYWGGQDNLNTRRKKQAEFLVENDVSPKCIIGFGCFNNSSKEKLISLGIPETKVKVIPSAYY